MAQPVNVCRRVEIHAGWIAKLQGKRNTHAAIQREIESLNADGYRVVWIHPDDTWGLLRTLWGFVVWLVHARILRVAAGDFDCRRAHENVNSASGERSYRFADSAYVCQGDNRASKKLLTRGAAHPGGGRDASRTARAAARGSRTAQGPFGLRGEVLAGTTEQGGGWTGEWGGGHSRMGCRTCVPVVHSTCTTGKPELAGSAGALRAAAATTDRRSSLCPKNS